MIHHERLADGLQSLGVELAVPVLVPQLVRRVPPHVEVDDAIHACDAVRAPVPVEPVQLQRLERFGVVYAYRRAPLLRLGREPHARVELAVPVADVAAVDFRLDPPLLPPVPVRLHDLVVVGEVYCIRADAHALAVPAPRLADPLLHRALLRDDRAPVRHLPVLFREVYRTALRRHGDRRRHHDNLLHCLFTYVPSNYNKPILLMLHRVVIVC